MFERKHGSHYGVHHFKVEKAGSLSDVVSNQLNISSDLVTELAWLGAIYLNENRFDGSASEICSVGDYLRVHCEPRRFHVDAAIEIVFENSEFVVVNKPAGLPVHAIVDNCRENLIEKLREISREVRVTHRLDIPTSGLIVLAKTTEFQSQFNEYLKVGLVEKKYRAQVIGFGEREVPLLLTHYMQPSPVAPKVVSSEGEKGWLECRLEIFGAREVSAGVHELDIQLYTGRTHQIRSQLAYEGYPIVGDISYGSKIARENEIALQSCNLKFPGFEFSASPPLCFWSPTQQTN